MSAHDLRTSAASALIRRHRLIVVLRQIEPPERLVATVCELADLGARVFEVTMDAADAGAALRAVRRALPAEGPERCLVGAGTVRSLQQLADATAAGAGFGVSPILDSQVLASALAGGLPFIPGAYSPTEADTAWRAGATFVKVFPASSLGPAYVREMRGPLREIELIPTGGIDAANAADFLAAGAVAVGVGTALVSGDAVARRAILDAAAGTRRP